jgi:hypothetical protein
MWYYVYVYNKKIYNENFDINTLNWYNIFTSENLKITNFYKSMELKYGLNLIQNFNLWPKNIKSV